MSLSHLSSVLLGPPGSWRYVRIIVYIFVAGALARLIPVPSFIRRAGGARPNPRRRRPRYVLWVGTPVLIAVLLGVGAWRLRPATSDRRVAASTTTTQGTIGVPAKHPVATANPAPPYVGVFEPGALASYSQVSQFAGAIGAPPTIVLSYSAWNVPFQTRFAHQVRAGHALPFIQLMPQGITISDISTGRYDPYLRSFAISVRRFGHQVLLGFGPEMEGNWYPWGRGHLAPSEYVRAWRHVVRQFRAEGARNVVWVWTVNNVLRASSPSLRQWWPGAGYVSWIGVDGYYYSPADTFDSVFAYTLHEVRSFTHKPVLISETAIGRGSTRPTQIKALFSGIRRDHLLGLVWFDEAQHHGLYHQDWRLEGNPAALSAFRSGVRGLLRKAPGRDGRKDIAP